MKKESKYYSGVTIEGEVINSSMERRDCFYYFNCLIETSKKIITIEDISYSIYNLIKYEGYKYLKVEEITIEHKRFFGTRKELKRKCYLKKNKKDRYKEVEE